MFDFVASIFNLNPRIGFVLEDTVWFNFELVYEDYLVVNLQKVRAKAKLYIPSTLNIALIQWHTQLNVCAVK